MDVSRLEVCPACGKMTLTYFRRVGRWRCNDPECGEELGSTPHVLQARATGHGVVDLATLPFPIAYPLAHARDPRLSARDRVGNAIFAGYQAMRTTALLLLSDYLASDVISHQLQGPIRGLRLPHWHDWTQLSMWLCRYWDGQLREQPERSSCFPNLVSAWQDVDRHGRLPRNHPWKKLLADLPGLQGKPAQGPIDALWKARNMRAHREATRTVDEQGECDRLPSLLAAAELVAMRLFGQEGPTLLRKVKGGAIRLQGPHLDLKFRVEDDPGSEAINWGASGLVARSANVELPIYPLFVPLDAEGDSQAHAGGGLIEPVALVDGVSERKVAVLGVRSSCDLPSLVGPVQAALARKEVQLGFERAQTRRWSLVNWAAVTAEDTLNALRERKYFPTLYVARRGVDDRVREVVDRPGSGLLLLGDAGAGKSSLLARLVEELIGVGMPTSSVRVALPSRDGDVVVFLSGAEAYKGDASWSGRRTLCEAVLRRVGIASGAFVDIDDLLRHLATTTDDDLDSGRRVWLLFDAINEADRFTDLLSALDEVLPALGRYPWLRLVISLRSGAYHALAQRHRELLRHGSEVFCNAHYLASFSHPSDEVRPYLEIRAFTPSEAKLAYELRQRNAPLQSCLLPHDCLTPSLQNLLRAPLYLHLFHQTFRDDTSVPDIDEQRLLAGYLDRLEQEVPGLSIQLDRLGRLMYETRSPVLTTEAAEAWVNEWRAKVGANNVMRVINLDPIEELVSATLLLRPEVSVERFARRLAGYVFSQQRLCEQVLRRELFNQIYPRQLPDGDELSAWVAHADVNDFGIDNDFQELVGALETVTAELAVAGHGSTLVVLLDHPGDVVRNRLLSCALMALGQKAAKERGFVDEVLAPLTIFAQTDAQLGCRFDTATRIAQQWLKEHGFGQAAIVLGELRITVLRAMVEGREVQESICLEFSAALDDLGRLTKAVGDGERARKYFEESLAVIPSATVDESRNIDIAIQHSASLINLGRLAEENGLREQAWRYFEQSVSSIRGLTEKHPQHAEVMRELSVSLNQIGRLAKADGSGAGALVYFEESLAIMRDLVATYPESVELRRDMSVPLNHLGRLAEAQGDLVLALGYLKESLEIRQDLVKEEPGRVDLRRDLSLSLNYFGRLMQSVGDLAGAQKYLEKDVEIMRTLVEQEPERIDLRREFATSLSYLGRQKESLNDIDGAKSCYEQDLEVMRVLVERQPERLDYSLDLAVTLNNLGRLAEASGDHAVALEYLEEDLARMTVLIDRQPERVDLQRELVATLSALGRLAESAGNVSGANEYIERSLRIIRALVAREPERADLLIDLAIIQWNQYRVAKPEDKLDRLDQVLETLSPLRQGGLVNSQLEKLWSVVKQEQSKLMH